MCGSAVGTGGGPDGCGSNDAGVVTGEAKRDADGAGAEELTAGELAARAGCDVTGTLGSELAEAAASTGNQSPRVQSLCVHNIPKSGLTPADVLAHVHLSVEEIVAAAVKVATPA